MNIRCTHKGWHKLELIKQFRSHLINLSKPYPKISKMTYKNNMKLPWQSDTFSQIDRQTSNYFVLYLDIPKYIKLFSK